MNCFLIIISLFYTSILKLGLAIALKFSLLNRKSKKLLAITSVFLIIAANPALAGNVVAKYGELNVTEDLIVADDALFVDSDNKIVGIGTTNPQGKLHVDGSVRIEDLISCTALETNANGDIICGADDIGDGSSTNEIQTLGTNGNDITLSNGGGQIKIPYATIAGSVAWGGVTGKPANLDTDSTNDITTANIGSQNVDKVDGFDLNQDVRTTASPSFAGLQVNGNLRVTNQLLLDSGEIIPTSAVSIKGDNIPSVSNTFDLGLSSLRWKDGYFSGTVNANSFSGDLSCTGCIADSEIQDNSLTAVSLADDSVGGSELVASYESGSAYDGRFINVGEKASDADLLDGTDKIKFNVERNDVPSGADWNTLTTPGSYGVIPNSLTGANSPSGTYSEIYPYGVVVVEEYDGRGIVQTYYPHAGTGGSYIVRRTGWNNGGWQPWVKVWHSNSDGSGSGLDADLLDGLNSASFLRKDTSDTIAGGAALYFNTGGWTGDAGGSQGKIQYHANRFYIDAEPNPAMIVQFRKGGTDLSYIDSNGVFQGTANYANSAGSASSATYATYINTDAYNMKLHWSGQGGQPTWLWGSNDGANSYVWNPSNFNVNYASSAGNADTTDSQHLGANNEVTFRGITPYGVGGDSGMTGARHYQFGYQSPGAWSYPYPDLVLGYHTGIQMGANTNYGGIRFYNDHPSVSSTEIMSIGNGDNNIRIPYNLYVSGNVGIGTTSPSEKLEVNGNIKVTGEIINGGQRCTVWKFDNRNGGNWKYFRYNMPYDCFPAWKNGGKSWGCTWQIDAEHHSRNSPTGVWEAPRGAQFIINGPNSDGSNHYYLKEWDASSGWQYDLQNGGIDHVFWTHWHDVARGYDGYYDGSWHEGTKAAVGWNNWGFMANQYTIAYLKICELPNTDTPTGASTPTYGP